MGLFDRLRAPKPVLEKHVYGVVIPEVTEEPSSKISAPGGYVNTYEYPDIPFSVAGEYYKTIGKVQNAVDSTVSKIITRDWYYAPTDENDNQDSAVKNLEVWEEAQNLSGIFESMIRDWLLRGNHWLG